MQKIRLGDILLQSGLINESHLQEALKQQELTPDKKLGDILMVFATSYDINRIISRYFGKEEEKGKKVKWEG